MSFTRDLDRAPGFAQWQAMAPGADCDYPERYSAWSLLRHGLTGGDWPRAWRTHDLKRSYDVVIIGAGVHGLAAAYYLARNHGITNVAVLDRGYLGGGDSGRNTAIVRSNYLTPEGVRFYNRSVKLYEELASESEFQRDVLAARAISPWPTLTVRCARCAGGLRSTSSRASDPKSSIRRKSSELVPDLDVSQDVRYPILGALYHAPGGIIRHDAVNWGYARAADACGIHIHQKTEVTGIDVENGRVDSVRTTRGKIATRNVLNCTAGWCQRRFGDGRGNASDRDLSAAGGCDRTGEAFP